MQLTILVRDNQGRVLARYPIDREWKDAQSSVREYYEIARRRALEDRLVSTQEIGRLGFAIDRGIAALRQRPIEKPADRSRAARDAFIASVTAQG